MQLLYQVICVLCVLCVLVLVQAVSFYDLEATDIQGNVVSMSKYQDAKAILVVNVASNCGFTYTNYRELIGLYDKYHDQGLEILAFPCNQFGDQEPGTNPEIEEFTRNYGVTFPMFSKLNVNGPDTHMLFKFLKNYSDLSEISWNFAKFLVVDGYPVRRYAPRVNPKKIEPDLLEFLNKPSQQAEM